MEPSESPRKSFVWPVVFLVLALALLGAGLYVFESIRSTPGELLEKGERVAEELTAFARAFREGTVSTSFKSYATEVSGGNHLQFATLREVEVFERTDSATVLWGQLSLPDVVVRVEAPVTYTYTLDLNGQWSFLFDGETVEVSAPRIEHNQPAIDISEMSYEIRSGSLLRDEDEALVRLRSGLTKLAARRADENIELVRELGRRKTEEFLRSWMLAHFPGSEKHRMVITFADEQPQPATPSSPRVEPPR